MKLHILKIHDRKDHLSDDMFYTIPFLRDRVVKDWYDIWDESSITKEQIIESDELLFDYMAVSYTHLRAHETPESLVCRLELEKK